MRQVGGGYVDDGRWMMDDGDADPCFPRRVDTYSIVLNGDGTLAATALIREINEMTMMDKEA